jgi:ligand-binding sensor domain-containing protein
VSGRLRGLKQWFIAGLGLSLGTTSVAAPAPGTYGNAPPEFLRFSVEDGLSQNTVRAILRDESGFLWVGTEEGLNRYDGYTFTVFKHQEGRPDSLPDNIVTALYEDPAGRLWVGTRVGVSLYDPRTESFRRVLVTPIDVRGLVADSDGALWVGTAGDGLYKLGPEGTKIAQYKKDDTAADSLSDNKVSALLRDQLGLLWIGMANGGLDAFDPAQGRFIHHGHDPTDPASLPADAIQTLAEDDRGNIWIGMQSGLCVLDPKQGTFRRYRSVPGDPKGLQADLVLSSFKDKTGTMWFGTASGLRKYVPADDSFVAYRHDSDNADTLSGDVIRAVYVDSQGNLWAGTFSEGLNVLRRERPGLYRYVRDPKNDASLIHDATLSFLEDRDGVLWVGTEEGGVHRFDPETGRLTRFRNGRAAILCLHQDRRGRIWVGTYLAGLSLFDPATGRFTPYVVGEDLRDDVVWAIDEDSAGVLWLATDNGLVELDTDARKVTRYRQDPANPDSVVNNFVRKLYRDDDGALWFGTFNGLGCLRQGHFLQFRNDPANPRSLIHNSVHEIFKDRSGRYWLGTLGGGLARFDPKAGTFIGYGRKEGLPSSVVYGMLEDDRGLLWLSTTRGLCQFDPQTGTALGFDPTVGLPARTFTQGMPLRTRKGAMLFGTTKGFYYFNPAKIVPSPLLPRLVLTSLRVFGEPKLMDVPLSIAEEIPLSYREHVVSLEFAVLDFTFPRRNLYAYKLDGASDWIPLGTRRDVTFTHLSPGAHRLQIKGSNSDGVWDEKGVAVRIVVAPPFWATWWWRAACLLALGGLVLLTHRLRVRHFKRSERELRGRVEEAVSRVKVLKGLVPICANCKKVRDDKGYWNAIDSYLSEHSDAEVSHDRCPECVAKDGASSPSAPAALFLLALLLPGACEAAGVAVQPAAARFVRLSSEQGLSNDNVNAVLQDRAGFIWVGTDDGLSRYDGHGFTVFQHDPAMASTIPDGFVAALYEDASGRLLVATSVALSRFDRRTETFSTVLPTAVTSVVEDRAGVLWVGSRGEGLYRFDRDGASPVVYRHDEKDEASLSRDGIVSLLLDHDGRLWVATIDGGLNLFDPEKNGFARYRHDPTSPQSLANDHLWSLAEDAEGALWVGTNGGVSVLDPARRTFRSHVLRLDDRAHTVLVTTAVYRDHAGTMWVGTDGGGLYRYVRPTDSFVVYRSESTNRDTLSGNVIRTIYGDTQGNLWMGTFNRGLSLLRRGSDLFLHYRHNANDPKSLSANIVQSFMEDADGSIWLGTDPGGLHRFDPGKGTFARQGSIDLSVMAIHRDGKGRLLVATYGGGLLQFDPSRATFATVWHSGSSMGSASADQVWSIHEDADGTLWLATDGGVVRIAAGTGATTYDRVPDSDPKAVDRNSVRALARDRKGDLWVATLGGLYRLTSDGKRIDYRHDAHDPHSLSHDWVTSLHVDRGGRLWAGTFGGGLDRFDPSTGGFVPYRAAQGLPSDVVLAILEDDAGALWLSTNRGLCRFDPLMQSGRAFGLMHGLSTLQFSLGAALRTRQGRMLFGSNDGLYSFQPGEVATAPRHRKLPVVLTSLRVFGASERRLPLLDLQQVDLPYRDNSFSLDFAVLDFTSARHDTYEYKLLGVNDQWTSLGTKPNVTFSRLAPGSYTFLLRAVDPDASEEAGASLRIVIAPPFWSTWWWRTGWGIALLALLFVFHRTRVRRFERREQVLKARVDEALSRVKGLRGVLPICPTCKKVKGDRGYWEWVESYVRDRSEVDFSHSICPACLALLYPDYVDGTVEKPPPV